MSSVNNNPVPSYSTATVSAADGSFYITDSSGNQTKVDLGTLMMMVNMQTVENLDAQIAAQLDEMQARNDQISALNDVMNYLNDCKSGGNAPTAISPSEDSLYVNGVLMTFDEACAELGISFREIDPEIKPDMKKNTEGAEKWVADMDSNIQKIKSQIDTLNTDSQMDNIELQNLLDKRNNAFEMTTQTMNTNNESVESVLRNL